MSFIKSSAINVDESIILKTILEKYLPHLEEVEDDAVGERKEKVTHNLNVVKDMIGDLNGILNE